MTAMWMVRAGRGSANIEEFLQHGIVALGDEKLGSLAPSMKKEELLHLYEKHYPDEKEGARTAWAGQFLRFLSEIKNGDIVVSFDRERRLYFLGSVVSDYEWAPKLFAGMPHVRHVQWTHQVARDLLSTTARNTLGAIQTLFRLSPEVAKEFQAHQAPLGTAVPSPAPVVEPAATAKLDLDDVRKEMLEKADEFIEDAISRLSWEKMQELVAGLLRAMGYRTTISEPGPDRGVDITASPDGLGLQEPRIFVEVKHREQTAMGSKELRSFLGGRRPGDRCLYVSTGGFTKDARYEADREHSPGVMRARPTE